MSSVTNYVILVQTEHQSLPPQFQETNGQDEGRFKEGQHKLVELLEVRMEAFGDGFPRLFEASKERHKIRLGPKAMEANVWIGAGNFFGPENMLYAIHTEKAFEDFLMVLCKTEDSDWFVLWPKTVTAENVRLTREGWTLCD